MSRFRVGFQAGLCLPIIFALMMHCAGLDLIHLSVSFMGQGNSLKIFRAIVSGDRDELQHLGQLLHGRDSHRRRAVRQSGDVRHMNIEIDPGQVILAPVEDK